MEATVKKEEADIKLEEAGVKQEVKQEEASGSVKQEEEPGPSSAKAEGDDDSGKAGPSAPVDMDDVLKVRRGINDLCMAAWGSQHAAMQPAMPGTWCYHRWKNAM